MIKDMKTQVVILGGGPAGYSAAFRCADLGLETTLIEKRDTLGGVCLNVGCIPSKALLHLAKIIDETKKAEKCGIKFAAPEIDLAAVRKWQGSVVQKLTSGLSAMAKLRKVKIIEGDGNFQDANHILVKTKEAEVLLSFEQAIIAAGSSSIQLPFIPHEDPRIWDSTDALALTEIPEKMLIMGGGIIGLEMGTVYQALGTKIDVVEMLDQVIPAADKDIVKIYTQEMKSKFDFYLETKVLKIEAQKNKIAVTFEGKMLNEIKEYDAVLVAIGRTPNGKLIGAEKAGIELDDRGFIKVDKQQRTNISHIYAVGDIVGQPMLAHKGVHEGHIAAEVIAGLNHYFDAKVIPSIAYTEPEVAWVGKTEKECQQENIRYEVANFPWKASGRAIASDLDAGMTKLIFDQESNLIIGGAIVGSNAGELLGEIALAIEMNCDAEDLALTIHAHPTLHESIGLAAEVYEGTITDLPNPKAKKK